MTACVLGWVLVGVAACATAKEPPADEVAALRREVSELRQRVEALEGRPRTVAGAITDVDAAEGLDAETVLTWNFEVIPGGAEITVDGDLVEEQRWHGFADGRAHLVRVRRAGFRVLEQAVTADRDRLLRYALTPGRGVQTLPSPR